MPAPPPTALHGVRWALLDDGGGRGLAVLAPRPLVCGAHAGVLRVRPAGPTAFALAPRGGARDRPRPSRPAPGGARARLSSADHPPPPPLRLAGSPGLVPLWAARPASRRGELLLADHRMRRGRALLQVAGAGEAWRCDAAGEPRQRLPASPDGDGFVIDHGPGELLLARWR